MVAADEMAQPSHALERVVILFQDGRLTVTDNGAFLHLVETSRQNGADFVAWLQHAVTCVLCLLPPRQEVVYG